MISFSFLLRIVDFFSGCKSNKKTEHSIKKRAINSEKHIYFAVLSLDFALFLLSFNRNIVILPPNFIFDKKICIMEPTRKIEKVGLRNLHMEDYDQLAKSFKRIYADSDVFWTRAQIKKLITIFPEGQVVIIVDDKIVGCALSIIVNYDMVKGDHTYAQVTGNETFNTHNPHGNILYGIEVFIHPDYRGLRLARRMYEYRKELCEKLNLKAIMFGGRIPNYHKYADQMRPKEYIEKVRNREIYDPVLTFQLSNDFHVRRVIRNYLPSDEESEHCATLLQWDNIYYQPPTDSYVDRKPTVRIGLVQWQMRPYASVDDLF